MLKILLKKFGRTFSAELGINLKTGSKEEVFKWFLASILFGARISETIAKHTYQAFERHHILTPEKIRQAGMGKLISLMGEGGYVRYDGVTSRKLIGISEQLIKEYGGDVNKIHRKAKNPRDLERLLKEFKGIGPMTTNIFLRELRGIWKKADPGISKFVKLAAKNLGIKNVPEFWQKNKVRGYSFVQFEAALLRLGKDYCHKSKCVQCELKKFCQPGKSSETAFSHTSKR